jgi:FemAB-related protein (PEP-CTERM system-associated)
MHVGAWIGTLQSAHHGVVMNVAASGKPAVWPVTVNHTVDQGAWDTFLIGIPHSCVFDTAAWQNAVHATYNQHVFWLTVKDQDRIRGVLPLTLAGGFPFQRLLTTGVFSSYGSVCAVEASIRRALIDRAIALTITENATCLQLKNTLPSGHERLVSHTDYQTYVLNLSDPKYMWTEVLTGKARTAIRKAESMKLNYRTGHHLFDAFYQIIAENMRRLGTPVHSRAFYRNILVNFGQNAEILVCYYEQVPIATLLTLRYKQVVTALSAASRSSYWKFNPNNFVYWEAMKLAHSNGAKQFDFGRSLRESGQAVFKKLMGAEPKDLYYEYFLNRVKVIPRIDQRNRRLHFLTSTWSRLPLPVTRWLGPSLIRNIP